MTQLLEPNVYALTDDGILVSRSPCDVVKLENLLLHSTRLLPRLPKNVHDEVQEYFSSQLYPRPLFVVVGGTLNSYNDSVMRALAAAYDSMQNKHLSLWRYYNGQSLIVFIKFIRGCDD